MNDIDTTTEAEEADLITDEALEKMASMNEKEGPTALSHHCCISFNPKCA